MHPGPRIRELRTAAGLTLAELGKAAGVQPSQLSRVESKKGDFNTTQIARIARALGATVGSLYGEVSAAAYPSVQVERGVRADGLVECDTVRRLLGYPEWHPEVEAPRPQLVTIDVPGADSSWFVLEVIEQQAGTAVEVGDLIICRPQRDAAPGAIVVAGSPDHPAPRLGRLRQVDHEVVVWPFTATGALIQPGKAGWRILAQAVRLRRDL